MTKGSHRCDRTLCRREAIHTVETVGHLDLLLCETHYELWTSGDWFKELPAWELPA